MIHHLLLVRAILENYDRYYKIIKLKMVEIIENTKTDKATISKNTGICIYNLMKVIQ